jgi:hypothetical protein
MPMQHVGGMFGNMQGSPSPQRVRWRRRALAFAARRKNIFCVYIYKYIYMYNTCIETTGKQTDANPYGPHYGSHYGARGGPIRGP